MKELDIMELCTLQALLIRYKRELDDENTDEISILENALDIVMDDIATHAEAIYEILL